MSISVLLCALGSMIAQAPTTEPSTMLPDYLTQRATETFSARRDEFETITTPELAEAYQEQLRAKMYKALGGFPQKTPLNPQVVGAGERDGFRYEKILFESRPGFHVPSTLYLPKTPPPYPVVLLPCGHYPVAKADPEMQRVAIFLALNGIAAFIYDPVGQGERSQILNDEGIQRFPSTVEHIMVGIPAMLVGSNTATFRIWDGIRAIDYLETRPDLDIKQLGCTGVSGGGTLTSYLMSLDSRIKAAAPVCYVMSSEKLLETQGPQDAEQNIFGQWKISLNISDYPLLHAPKPTLLCCATRDFFHIDGTWDSFRQAKRYFGVLGVPEHIDIAETNAEHGYSAPLRQAMVRFMLRHLAGRSELVVEPEITPIPLEELLCTPGGQVLNLPGERTMKAINTEVDDALAKEREVRWKTGNQDANLAEVRALASVRMISELPQPITKEIASEDRDGYTVTTMELITEPGIILPLYVARANTPSTKVCIYAPSSGVAPDMGVGGPVEERVKAGWTVLAVDLRGLGSTRSVCRLAAPFGEWFGDDWQDIYMAYLLGESYVGMRAEDLVQVARASESILGFKSSETHIEGKGQAYIGALHAAVLEPSLFNTVKLDTDRMTWHDVVRTELVRNQFANAVNGALLVYDVSDLEALLEAQGKLIN